MSVADDQIKSYFRRWQNLEADKKAISDDLRELFAEAKGNGFDGKALREAFRRVVKADDQSNQEHEAIVDLYVTSLTRDAREGMVDQNADRSEGINLYANETGRLNASTTEKEIEPTPQTEQVA